MNQTEWIPFINDSADEIPPFAVMRVTGVDDEGRYTVDEPNEDDVLTCVFNGETSVPAGGGGKCTASLRPVAAYDEEDGEPAVGEEWGVASGFWKLKAGRTGYRVAGGAGSGVGNFLRAGGSAPGNSCWKEPVRCVSEVNVTISSPGTNIGGVTLDISTNTAYDRRVLLAGQTTGGENGIYLWNGGSVAMTRADDADANNDIVGAIVPVQEGTGADTLWQCTVNTDWTAGSTGSVWRQISPLPSAEVFLSTYAITTDATWQDVTGSSISLGIGRYMLHAVARGNMVTSGGSGATIRVRLVDGSGNSLVEAYVVSVPTGNANITQTIGFSKLAIFATATTVKMQAYRSAGPTWTTSSILGNLTGDATYLGYFRIHGDTGQ